MRIEKELQDLLNQASENKLWAVQLAVCSYAMTFLADIDANLLNTTRENLLMGTKFSDEMKDKLESQSWHWDDKYLTLHDKELDEDEEELNDDELKDKTAFYTKARALKCLSFAAQGSTAELIGQCVYEAASTIIGCEYEVYDFVTFLLHD